MRSINEVAFKDNPDKKYNIEWSIAVPHVTFFYKEKKNDEEVLFIGKLDYLCLMEKLGLQKTDNDRQNVNTLLNALLNYFKENKVILESFEEKNYALEFKGEEDKTLFKVYLKN